MDFKTIAIIGLSLVCLFLGFKYLEADGEFGRVSDELVLKGVEFETLNEHVARLETKYTEEKAVHERAKREWTEVSRHQKDQITQLSDATFLLGRHVRKQNGPDYYFETPLKTRNFVYNEIRIAGKDSPPIGFLMIKNDGRTYKGNYSFKIVVKNLQTQNKRGEITVYSKAFLVAQEPGLAKKRRPDFKNWVGEEFPLPIESGSVTVNKESFKTPKGFWTSPKLNLGVSVYESGAMPSASLSLFGYGRGKNDLDYKILSIGADFGDSFSSTKLSVMPVSFRPLPSFFANTYLGAGAGVSPFGVSPFLNLSVEL